MAKPVFSKMTREELHYTDDGFVEVIGSSAATTTDKSTWSAPPHSVDPPSWPGLVDRKQQFANVVDMERASESTIESLPQPLLCALLEDPSHVLVWGNIKSTSCPYERIELHFAAVAGGTGQEACKVTHEISQMLQRRLSFGRRFGYRIHRFTLEFDNSALTHLALRLAALTNNGLQVSNIGGFHSTQDLFRSELGQSGLLCEMRSVVMSCVRQAAAADVSCTSVEPGETPPSSPRSDESLECWANVSSKGDLNVLHHHAGATYAATYYAQVPGGSLLFRLTPGCGVAHAEPDEERHVPWMCDNFEWLEADALEQVNPSAVHYAEVHPTAGTLLVFPGWLSHSVSPHFASSARVSFASNWDFL